MAADLRVLVARALNSADLSPSDFHETNIDRIGALAFADPLGGELWALKWGFEARAFGSALDLLVHRAKRACRDQAMRQRLCRAALIEWLDDLCNVCMGRGQRAATALAPKRACEVCRGSGKRRVSELWRAHELNIDVAQYRRWEPQFATVERKIAEAEERAYRDIARQLGRVHIVVIIRPLDMNSQRGLNVRAVPAERPHTKNQKKAAMQPDASSGGVGVVSP